MTAVKRRLNYTGRKRIPQSSVAISLLPRQPGEVLRASASFELAALGFPSTGCLVLEAYQRSQGMRFEIGTVGTHDVTSELILNEIDPGDSVLFRLKVVEGEEKTGRILGAANRVRPDSSECPEGRRRLFPVEELDLGQQPWRVKITPAGPVLHLCAGLNLAAKLQTDPIAQGTILPVAFRQVLHVLADGSVDDDDGEEVWRADWLRYCREGLSIQDDPSEIDDEKREEWVDDAVAKFARRYKFSDRIKAHEATLPCS